jgi:hypothetical protein
MGKKSIVQANGQIPDLGAPKMSYELIEYTDCTPPLYAIGIRVDGKRTGILSNAIDEPVTSPSKQFLREHCMRKGIPPHVEGATST